MKVHPTGYAMKVAVVGVGRWGINHVRVLSEIRRSERDLMIDEIIVVDADRSRAKHVADLFSVSFADALDDLAKSKVDAAIVAVPTVYHHSISIKLLPHMNVLVEKPIAARLEEAEEMGRLAEREGRLLAVGHVEKFNPVVLALKDRIEGEEVVHVSAQRVGPGPPSGYTLNLGVAHDLLIHDVDVACYLLGEPPTQVVARAWLDERTELETDIAAIFVFESKGVYGDFRASWRTSPNLKRRVFTVQLEDKVLEADYILQTLTLERGLAEHKSRGEYSEIISAYTSRVRESHSLMGVHKEPLLLEDFHFLSCIAKGKRPLNSWEEGYKALKCVISALEAARNQGVVRISW